MVTIDFKQNIIEKHGKGTAKRFHAYLKQKKIKNTKGQLYSESGIRDYIYCVDKVHRILDDHFLKFIIKEQEAAKKQQEKTKELMEQIHI